MLYYTDEGYINYPFNERNFVSLLTMPQHQTKQSTSSYASTVFDRWVSRRIPPDSIITLGQRNIFIIPTWEGLGFGLLLLLLLLTAINYQNSLIYLITFFMGGLFVTSIHFCFRNLEGLTLAFKTSENCFAGEQVRYHFKLSAPESKRYHRLFVSNEWESYQWVDVNKGADVDVVLSAKTDKRGIITPGRILIETRFPMGLLRAWSWLDLKALALVYPKPVEGEKQLVSEGDEDSNSGKAVAGVDDFSGIRDYVQGDQPNRIAWKQFAAKGELYVKTFESAQFSTHWIDYDAYPSISTELRLSHLSFELVKNEANGHLYGLKLPGNIIDFNNGQSHLTQCLSALATFGHIQQ